MLLVDAPSLDRAGALHAAGPDRDFRRAAGLEGRAGCAGASRPLRRDGRRPDSSVGLPGEGARQLLIVYHDPPTGRALDVVDFRSSLIGFLHRFHENLTIPDYSGRAIVGWAGVGMLVLSLTGIWLWWPRNGAFLRGLHWRRSGSTNTNLHHLLGFWISLPLAFVSLTGIYLSFPQTARSTMAAIAPINPPERPIFAGQLARETQLTADAALEAARAAKAGWHPAAVFFPTIAQGGPQGPQG